MINDLKESLEESKANLQRLTLLAEMLTVVKADGSKMEQGTLDKLNQRLDSLATNLDRSLADTEALIALYWELKEQLV
jgi:hypothetical protein